MLEHLHQTRGYHLYTLADRPDFLLVTQVRAPGPGRPLTEFQSRNPAFIVALREMLLKQGILLRSGGSPCFRFGSRIEQPATESQTRALLTSHIAFGVQHVQVPLTCARNSASLDVERLSRYEIAELVADLATNPQGERLLHLLPLCATDNYSGLLIHESEIPEMGARLRWPMMGDVPTDPVYEMPLAPAECGRDYPRLKQLFSEFWLDEISHARLHMFLLGCFDVSYLTHSVPLLTIDSFSQGMGKSEAAEAVANLLHGYRTPAITPARTPSPDQMASHFGAGHLVAVMDNLDNATDWSNPWLASILTQRGAAERLRYDRASTNFRARSAILTFVFGRATLHEDLISRAWRVQIWGDTSRWADGAPPHFAKDYALEHRDELVAECYWAMKRGRAHDLPTVDRSTVFAKRAAGAYLEVFGKRPPLTDAAHRAMISTLALQLLKRERAAFPRRPVNVDLLPANAPVDTLEGGTALGMRVVDGKLKEASR